MSRNISSIFGFLPDGTYTCSADSFSCTDLVPPCRTSRFNFQLLWNITSNYVTECGVTGKWLFGNTTALTQKACEAITGPDFTPYPGSVIYARIATWKLPILQLVANSPKPPLGKDVEFFVAVHLFGDPIGSLTDILYKIECCQATAIYWHHNAPEQWKQFSIIVDSFDEWGIGAGNSARRALSSGLQRTLDEPEAFREVCSTTAGALAADRSTHLSGIGVALFIFVSAFIISIVRAGSSGLDTNVEMHSLAFSTLYLWLVPLTILTSIVGASQTKEAIPRILKRFSQDLDRVGIQADFPDISGERYGGIYTWQSDKLRLNLEPEQALQKRYLKRLFLSCWPMIRSLLPILIVGSAVTTGILISYNVPPEGWLWNCRPGGETHFLSGWIISYVIGKSISLISRRLRMDSRVPLYCMLTKDIIATLASIGWILATQYGIYNHCSCYTRYGRVGLALPDQPETRKILLNGLKGQGIYIRVFSLGLAFQLFLILLIIWRYYFACRVYIQSDTGTSNIPLRLKIPERTIGIQGVSQSELSPTSASQPRDNLELVTLDSRSLPGEGRQSLRERGGSDDPQDENAGLLDPNHNSRRRPVYPRESSFGDNANGEAEATAVYDRV